MTKTFPLVSIVTPSYNAMPYIKETIDSIHSQGYPNLEHIIYDGGSTDGTTEWVTKNHPQITYVSEKDRGQSHALNKGFKRAKGEIIGWLNADDTYEPGSIQRAVDFLLENQEYDLVGSDINIIDEQSNNVGVTFSKPFKPEQLFYDNYIKQPTVFMTKKVIDALEGVDEQYHYVMDREFWLRAGMAGFQMKYLKGEQLANFRLIQGTKSFEDVPNFRNEWYEVMLKAFKHDYFSGFPENERKKVLNKNRSAFYIAKMVQAIDGKNRGAMFSNMVKAIDKDKSLVWNKGIWKYFYLGVTGSSTDRLRKFKKNAETLEHA